MKKDIILIAGQNAVGKTTASSYFMQVAKERGIAYEPRPIDDFSFLYAQTIKDDVSGGHRHYHDWSGERSQGHSHANGEARIPFVVTHTALSDSMHNAFFNAIASLPQTGKFWFVEWTGGCNTNPPGNPAAQADFSFTRASKMLNEGRWPLQWLERIHAVIHISADTRTRFLLNTEDSEYPLLKESSGQTLVRRITTVLEIFGRDDFSSIEPLFRDAGIELIFSLRNMGDSQFYDKLVRIGDSLFKSLSGLSGPPKTIQRGEEIGYLV